MADFLQNGRITTLHELGTLQPGALESLLRKASSHYKIGLVLPVTAADMRADPFRNVVNQLRDADYIDTIVVVLGLAPQHSDYIETRGIVSSLGERSEVLWADGPRISKLHDKLTKSGFSLGNPGKGLSVWTAFGYLLADPTIKAFALHDCDIVDYSREMLARLCLPMAHPSLDFEFCKAYYARVTDRMHGRVVRLLVSPLLRALLSVFGEDPFLRFLDSFHYPLAGEFAVTSTLARSNRIPSDWGLEVGTLSEVFRNTSLKRVCQVDLGKYEHKHQSLSLDDPSKGLMKMSGDILTSILRTLASRGTILEPGHFVTLRAAYLRHAQDAIRQYHADSLINGLLYDRHIEEQSIEGFSRQIITAGDSFQRDPSASTDIPNWTRVLAAYPEFPQLLREAARADAAELD